MKKILAVLVLFLISVVGIGHSAWTDTIAAYPSNQVGSPGDSLGYTWIVTTSSGASVMTFRIDWGDQSTTVLQGLSDTWTISQSHVYTTTGVYIITVRADDYGGNSGIGGAYATIRDPPTTGGAGGHCCPKPV